MTEATKKVLIIDDEEIIRDTLADRLQHVGIDVCTVSGGIEGLEKALSEKPDLVLLDIIMPDLDGWEVLKRLRADSWGKSANIILLSILNDENSTMKALEYGVRQFIVKSDWHIDQMVTTVKENLGMK